LGNGAAPLCGSTGERRWCLHCRWRRSERDARGWNAARVGMAVGCAGDAVCGKRGSTAYAACQSDPDILASGEGRQTQ